MYIVYLKEAIISLIDKMSIKHLAYIILALLLLSCKEKTIEVSDIDSTCNVSIFHGLRPDSQYSELCNIAGSPNEFIETGRGEDKEKSPVYYLKDAKLVCHWSGDEDAPIGVIDWIPYQNKTFTLNQFFKASPSEYGIDSETEKFRVYKDGTWYFSVYQENNKLTKVSYWLVKK